MAEHKTQPELLRMTGAIENAPYLIESNKRGGLRAAAFAGDFVTPHIAVGGLVPG